MHTERMPATRAVWGLWFLLSVAAVGFFAFVAGVVDDRPGAMLGGAALLAFATILYLFVHFWHTARDALSVEAPAPVPAPAPTARPVVRGHAAAETPARRPMENFDHLLSHTLERVPPPQPAAPAAEPTAPWAASAATGTWTRSLLASAGPEAEGAARPPPPRDQKEHVVSAVHRRNDIVRTLPTIRSILDETTPVTDPARPGKTRGQCSGCQTMLWAPTVRPIRIRCPNCGKSAWLEK